MALTRRGFVAGAAALTATGAATGAATGVQVLGGPIFGSYWRVLAEQGTPALQSVITRELLSVDLQMSPYRRASALCRFNRAPPGVDVLVPKALKLVATQALALADLTEGAFDPTVGPAVSRYGFGPIEGARSSWRDIKSRDGALRKRYRGGTLDLCGIAKGHAADRVADVLRARGVANALIDIGGEIRALGRHPADRNWQVAVADPAGGTRALAVLAPQGKALATSGPLPQGYSGRGTVSHLIDPRNGRPVDHALVSVTVLAARCTEADGLATALCVMGPEEGAEFAETRGIDALLVARDGAQLRQVGTGTFNTHRTD